MGIKERKEREKERRRQQILVAAKRVFAGKGFGRATMEDIANEAELSPGTLYLYFKSKDELSASLSIRMLEYFIIRIEHLANDTQFDAKSKILELKKALFDIYAFDPLIFKSLFLLKSYESVQHLNPQLMTEIERLCCEAMEKISSVFQIGIQKGVCLCTHPREMAEIIWAMFYGIVLWMEESQTKGQTPARLEKIVDRAFDIFERGALV